MSTINPCGKCVVALALITGVGRLISKTMVRSVIRAVRKCSSNLETRSDFTPVESRSRSKRIWRRIEYE